MVDFQHKNYEGEVTTTSNYPQHLATVLPVGSQLLLNIGVH
jgi:hypothetical protein